MIPSKFHNFLIGSGGRIVQSLSEECGGVQIKFPDSKSKSDRVTITGPKEDVEKAKKQLLGKMTLEFLLVILINMIDSLIKFVFIIRCRA